MIMMLYHAYTNRLVEDWDIASAEHCSRKLNPSLSSNMNLELVPVHVSYSTFLGVIHQALLIS